MNIVFAVLLLAGIVSFNIQANRYVGLFEYLEVKARQIETLTRASFPTQFNEINDLLKLKEGK